jgi:hypothetical protein
VAAGDRHGPDWRDASAYEPLLNADPSLFAWEWLRRNSGYRAAAEQAFQADGSRGPAEPRAVPERWGLHAFEPPGVRAPEARPVWCAEVHPYVLKVQAGSPDGDDVFDLQRFIPISTLVRAADDREHLLISDGLHAIRIDVVAGTIADGPAVLRYRLNGLASAERPVLTLRRFLALWRTGRFCRSLHPDAVRAKRWLLMLRAHDALTAGANQREITAVLLSAEAGLPLWRSRSPSLRAQTQRLVRGARRMASSGYLELLR